MWRAARPMVWMSELSERRKPSLSASRIATSDDFGHVQALAQQVDADQHVEFPEAQVADDLGALHRLDVRVQVAHAHAVLVQVLGEVLRHALGERRDEHALTGGGALLDLGQHVIDLRADRAHFDLRIDEPGRPHQLLDHLRRSAAASYVPGVAETKIICGASCSHSSNFSGRLSSAEGRRKPYSTSISLRERSPLYMRAELRNRLVALVDDQQRIRRQVVEQARRRLARLRARRGSASSSRCRRSSRPP